MIRIVVSTGEKKHKHLKKIKYYKKKNQEKKNKKNMEFEISLVWQNTF